MSIVFWRIAALRLTSLQCDISEQFYANVYTTDNVDFTAIENYFASLPTPPTLPDTGKESLTEEITIEDIATQSSHIVTKSSSQGTDGLVCPFLYLLFHHLPISSPVTKVYNEALAHGIAPES